MRNTIEFSGYPNEPTVIPDDGSLGPITRLSLTEQALRRCERELQHTRFLLSGCRQRIKDLETELAKH